jgi:hypothetical protein
MVGFKVKLKVRLKSFVASKLEKIVFRWRFGGDAYPPSLVGMRVLEGGRLALAFGVMFQKNTSLWL